MGSLTAGILAGKKKYVKNIYLQNLGIGRGMKVGKEAIYAAIIGVENWYKRDWTKEINNQKNILQFWLTFLAKEKFKGITYEIIADPTGNKINRLRVHVDSKISKFTIQSLSYHLEKNNPAIFVRDDLIHLNHFELDTCNLKKGQERVVMNELKKIILQLNSRKIKNNISQKEYSITSNKEWLSWLN
jgi:L-seryl-tRNA(Ser) seleniumtransferase